MCPDWDLAKNALLQGTYTCAACKDGTLSTSTKRGVTPLLGWLEAGSLAPGFCAADRVVGKATAFLYCLLGAKAVYARVMSESALTVLQNHGITPEYGRLVPYIRNRTDTGMCPMEAATLALTDPAQALAAIRQTLAQLTK